MKVSRGWIIWIVVLAAVLFLDGDRLLEARQWNVRALLFLKGNGDSIPTKASGCNHFALIWAEAGKRGDLAGQRHILEHALGCSQINISIIRAVLPLDKDMALLATQLYPDSSESWFWLGDSIAPTDPLRARQAYSRVLASSRKNISILRTVLPFDKDMALLATQLYPDSSESWFWLGDSIGGWRDLLGARQAYLHAIALSPHNSMAWCGLGYNYEINNEFEKSSEAYLNCCSYGDPGSNGCYGAGRMMEQLGDPQQAIEYYRRSRWEGSLNRADELENQLSP